MVINPVRKEEWALLEACLKDTKARIGDTRLRMLELGNKVNTQAGPNKDLTITYKRFFTALGYLHVSVDTNGKDGALSIDLREHLASELQKLGKPTKYHIVTNIGTTEHVQGKQEQVWTNLWEALEDGGWLLSITPKPGAWWWHGEYYPTLEFYAELAKNFTCCGVGEYGPPDHRNLTFVGRRDDLKHKGPFVYPGDDLIYLNKMRRVK